MVKKCCKTCPKVDQCREINEIRDNFPALRRCIYNRPLIYLDNAASTLKTKEVIESINSHYAENTANIHRGIHFLSEQGTRQYEETREAIRGFINADKAHEIIFTKGTTESINLVASSFGYKFLNEGDEIVISTMEHHSNIVPWQLIAEKSGAIIKVIPINDDGEIIIEEYEKLLSDRTKIVSVVHISNTLGTINPIKKMIKMAHNHGAKFLVDAAQSVAHTPIDVKDLDCDLLAFSAHKIFGPTGVGVLYGKEDLLNEMPPYQGGGDMIDSVSFEKTTYNTLPHKFEAGTPHIAGVIAFKGAIDYVKNVGLETIGMQEEVLLNYATEKMLEIDGLKIIGTSKEKASVISFVIDGIHPNDIGTLLDQQGIAIRTGHHCTQPLMKRFNIPATARVSFCFYNNLEEVDAFIAGLKKVLEFI